VASRPTCFAATGKSRKRQEAATNLRGTTQKNSHTAIRKIVSSDLKHDPEEEDPV
jgi:hypothetical protein